MGLSHARNTALRRADAEYIAAVDADVVLDKYWLEYLMMNFISEEIAGCGGKLLEENTLTVVDRWRQVNMAQYTKNNRKINPYTIVGSNTVYKKKSLEAVGGYNDKFTTNHEDTDLSLRVKMLGLKLVFDPRAIAHHSRTDNLKSLLNTFWRYYKVQQGEITGAYENFTTLKYRVTYNIHNLFARLSFTVKNKRFHLLYPDILSGFWNILEDVIHVGKYSKLPGVVVSQTFLAVLAGFRRLLESRKGVSRRLIDFVLEDLRYLVDLLKTEFGPSAEDGTFIYEGDSFEFQEKYKKLKVFLPRADFKFARYAIKLWKTNKRFIFTPLIWKMAEVSAQRVRYEERSNPSLLPGVRVCF
jgi:glycosyltransferase involved in cell wall biosynthesis